MKILFLVPYPTEGASNRIRVEQYLPYLEAEGIGYKVRPFVNRPFYKILYKPHCYIEKTFWFFICTVNRLLDLARALRFDVIFVHREAYPFGGPFMETILHKIGKPIIFDFDDAIFLPNTSEHNIYIERFKKPGKISKIIAMSNIVIAGNNYLKDFAIKFNRNVIILPSPIDTKKYTPLIKDISRNKITIGWMGSKTTRAFLYEIKDVLNELSGRYDNLFINVVGTNAYGLGRKNIINEEWSLDKELASLHNFDIGIMPMPDTQWTRGKCGFKVILYMAAGIPVVCSSIGMNKEIVEDGVNGFLARDKSEWVKKLSTLIEDRELRNRLGLAGRKRVEERYSLEANAAKFIGALKEADRE